MKKIILVLALLAGLSAHAQSNEKLKEQLKQQTVQLDSSSKNLNDAMNNMQQSLDSLRNANMQKQAQRSGEMMLQWHKERQAKQKKQMFMYLGLGIFFLVVLVFGLMRKGRARKIS
jgi:predicted ribosome quality control (RQC) complex YloA/Tae2 family protein